MPFLAPLLPAIAGGIASSAAGAGIAALTKGAQSKPSEVNLDTQQLQEGQGTMRKGIQAQGELINALQAANAVGKQNQVYGQGQDLASQLALMAQGQGPSPAQAQLAQATGQNVAQQAALMAGQRGAGANAGLLARQAAMAGAGAQQGAAGQAATLRAQEQLAAINALQNQQSMLGGLATNQVGAQQAGIGQYGQMASAQTQAALDQQRQALAQQQGLNQIQAEQGKQQSDIMGKIGGGIASGLGVSSLGKAFGIEKDAAAPVKKAEGGPIGMSSIMKENYSGPRSRVGQHFMKFAEGGKVDALVSPGERYLPPAEVAKVAAGKKEAIKAGEKIPGKPKVGGAKNSYANDTVPKKLDHGGIVLPRSVTQAKDSAKKAQDFVDAIVAHHGLKRK